MARWGLGASEKCSSELFSHSLLPGPVVLEGDEGFWLMVEGPLPLATSTQLSTFDPQLAQQLLEGQACLARRAGLVHRCTGAVISWIMDKRPGRSALGIE